MLIPKFLGEKKDGQLVYDYPKVRQAYIEGMKDGRFEEIIQKPTDPKTLQQLRYFHGVVCQVASEASGYTKEEVKGLLKGEFLTKYVKSPTGKEIAWVPSLGDLAKPEMSKFIDDCVILIARHWSAVVPSPDQVVF